MAQNQKLSYKMNMFHFLTKFESDDAETMLVGHVPIELSMLLSRFLKVCGKRRREVGLVIPGHYKARTKSRSHCKILDRELN